MQLDSMIFKGPFQLEIFYDSMYKCKYRFLCYYMTAEVIVLGR